MTSISRQNTLFVSEDWKRIYEALKNIDFTAYDQDSLRSAIVETIRINYPDEFDDWIGSSEFVIKLDTLTYLASVLSYRIDMNTRESFLSTAERRDSLLRLAYNIAYQVTRNQANTGEFKITRIATNQRLLDLDDNVISGSVNWNDPSDPDWFSKWLIVMDAAFDSRTKYGKPLRRYQSGSTDVSQYRFNSPSPSNGSYSLSATTVSGSQSFEIINILLNESTGIYEELSPNRFNSFHALYKQDGLGAGSTGTGFFLPFKQGKMAFQDVTFTDQVPMRTVNINVDNINDQDVFVTRIDSNADILEEWTQVQTVLNESLAYNPNIKDSQVFEVNTRANNQITVRFGDGKFGKIPAGIFRIWYRVSEASPVTIRTTDIQNQTVTFPYVSDGEIYNLRLTYSLMENVNNGSSAETNDQIRQRANKIFYTQNRMVNGEDYNSFVYSDPTIVKAKAVNRTFSGQGKSVPLRDPSGTYNNVSTTGTDGRIFKDSTSKSVKAVFNTAVESVDTFIDVNITPIIKQEDKQILYYDDYPRYTVSATNYIETSSVNDRSRGKLDTSTADGNLNKIVPNAIIFFNDNTSARVDYVVDGSNGLLSDSVLLKRDVTGTVKPIKEIMPPLRRTFTEAEEAAVAERILFRKTFGLTWNSNTISWNVIATEDLNSGGAFSLSKQGDKSGSSLDASWLITLEYSVGEFGEDQWTITDRGLSVSFESEKDVEFFHVNDRDIVDSKTGQKLRDNIALLKTNEVRDSLPRRGVKSSVGSDPYTGKILLTGDGTTKAFDLNVDKVDESTIFFLVNNVAVNRSDWSIDRSSGIPRIVFDAAPADGEFITLVFDPRKSYATVLRKNYTGDDSQKVFSLSKTNIRTDNTFAFVATKLQRPYEDYYTHDTSSEGRIQFQNAPGEGSAVAINYLAGGAPALASYNFTGDGVTARYPLHLTTSYVMVFVNGDRVTDYTILTDVIDAYEIEFSIAPEADAKIHIRALIYDDIFTIHESVTTASVGDVRFEPPSGSVGNAGVIRTMVWVNGAYQHDFTYDDGIDDIVLSSPLSGGEKVIITNFTVTGVLSEGYDIVLRSAYNADPKYLPKPVTYLVHDRLRHTDGYSNVRGIKVTNIDEDLNGEIDAPFNFYDFVIDDDKSDLVLWRQITENGFDIWEPISETSVPRATYHSILHQYHDGDTIDDATSVGDIHYDTINDVWLIAGATVWGEAEDQTVYRWRVGRSGVDFRWTHYASDEKRIDPAASNIIDMFVLTSNYDTELRRAVSEGKTIPDAPTSNAIRTQYQGFEDYKMLSDTLIWHPARYKLLFGTQALPELRAKFLVVRTPGSTIPDNDLKLRVLAAIDEYFDINVWDFGEKLYYTELCSYIHMKLATVIQSIVPVSISGEPFGRLFEIRSEPDELFLSSATSNEIEIVDSLSDKRLNIKV